MVIKDLKDMIDSHVHIDFDRIESELELYVQKAEEKDIKEFTVTNHIILPNIPSGEYVIRDDQVFLKDMSYLKCSLTTAGIKQYVTILKRKEASNVYLGAEIDYHERYEEQIREFISMHPFDLILGSLHFLDGYCISRKLEMQSFVNKIPVAEIHRKYFIKLRRLVKSELFDVVSHVDLVRKHLEPVRFEEYAKEAGVLIDDLLEHDMGIEVNTSGHAFIDDSYPSLEFLVLCKEKGLDKVTIGSDAHKVESLGEHLEKAVEKLKHAGYEKIVKFKNRKPEYVSI